MDSFKEYQDAANQTAIYRQSVSNLTSDPKLRRLLGITYAAIGLSGEAGELLNKVKKLIRDGNPEGYFTTAELELELGDTLWYIAALCAELGSDMGDVAQLNLDKLKDRQGRAVLGGSGDQR